MSPPRLCQICCLAAAAVALLAGCATGGGSGRYVVTARTSPFYKYGPAQAFGADFALTRGQKLTVVENSFGFSRVTTDDGIPGFMATEDLAPAPPELAAPVRAPARVASRRPGASRTREATYIEPGAPLFDGSDIPLPTNSSAPKIEPPAPNPQPKPAPRAPSRPSPPSSS